METPKIEKSHNLFFFNKEGIIRSEKFQKNRVGWLNKISIISNVLQCVKNLAGLFNQKWFPVQLFV